MKTIAKLETGIEIRVVPTEDFEALTGKHASQIFDDSQYFFRPRNFYTAEEIQKVTILKQNLGKPLRLNLVAFDKNEVAGWSWGLQDSSESFYMVNSAVLPQFRKKGIYGKLVSSIVEEASSIGFQVIYSKHVATNNAVLIPKLKAGFNISSFEVSDQYGVLIHLKWHSNPTRRKMVEFRAGGVGFDGEVKKILKL
jgi:hypothetical protein